MIDESGKLLENPRVVQIDENTKKAYLLADPLESGNGKPVYLSQKDIREVQLAKGAIAAGIALLAEQMGITLEQVEQVYIAGGSMQDRNASRGSEGSDHSGWKCGR